MSKPAFFCPVGNFYFESSLDVKGPVEKRIKNSSSHAAHGLK